MKFPVIKAHENGGLEMVRDNGWVQVTGEPDNPNCISLFTYEGSDTEGMSLAIINTHLNVNAEVVFVWAETLTQEILIHKVRFEGADDCETELENAIVRGLWWLQVELDGGISHDG